MAFYIRVRWLKWIGIILGILCDGEIFVSLKDKLTRSCPTLLYDVECLPIKKIHDQKIKVVEIRI